MDNPGLSDEDRTSPPGPIELAAIALLQRARECADSSGLVFLSAGGVRAQRRHVQAESSATLASLGRRTGCGVPSETGPSSAQVLNVGLQNSRLRTAKEVEQNSRIAERVTSSAAFL